MEKWLNKMQLMQFEFVLHSIRLTEDQRSEFVDQIIRELDRSDWSLIGESALQSKNPEIYTDISMRLAEHGERG